MKNKSLLFMLMVFLLLIIAACSNDTTSKGSSTDDTTSEDSSSNQEDTGAEESSNLTESGMPIVKEEITLDLFTSKSGVNLAHDWNDLLVWNKYEDMTNIDVNWVEQVSKDGLAEKRNLALASGNLPDVFYASNLSNTDLFRYGQQGTFLKLNDLIDQHAPNLKAFLENNPEVKKGITFPDGNIYSMPSIRDEAFLSIRIGARPWFNQQWLDNLGLDMPETTDEYYEVLKAIKTGDPNGNGEADEIPYGGVNIDHLIGWIRGSFGIGNRGPGLLDIDPSSSELRFIPTSDGYKEMLTYLNKLYSEGLIQETIFSIKWGQFTSTAAEGKYGSTVFYSPAQTFGGKAGKHFVGAFPLTGPNGDQLYSQVVSPLFSTGGFAITSENEHPEASVRWLDYFYSDKGAELLYMGVEGETFEVTEDGEYEYVDKITNSSEGLTMNQEISKYIPWVGVNPPGIVKQQFFKGSESAPQALDAAEKIKPYIPEEIWPEFTYKKDENDLLTSAGTDIEKYVKEMRDLFISGELPLSEWDSYVEQIKNMGLEEYMNVQKSAYERYNNN
jgi:putative aldouronate transport system substrate-binding protein